MFGLASGRMDLFVLSALCDYHSGIHGLRERALQIAPLALNSEVLL
jgi:hypothetical protein